MSGSLTVAQVARLAAVSPDTVRYYERRGLLPGAARSPSRYRQFDSAVVDRIRFIRAKQRLGLPLQQIGHLLSVSDEHGCARDNARSMLHARLSEINMSIADLTGLRAEIIAALADIDCETT